MRASRTDSSAGLLVFRLGLNRRLGGEQAGISLADLAFDLQLELVA